MKTNIEWKYGENKYHQYYEAKVGNDYYCRPAMNPYPVFPIQKCYQSFSKFGTWFLK